MPTAHSANSLNIKTSQVRNHRGQSDGFRYVTSFCPLSPTVCLSFHLALRARTGHSRYETVLIQAHPDQQGKGVLAE